jgi:solute carrier family 13 (sodium-dependent dicarboxylate transporter), member 2/3/5
LWWFTETLPIGITGLLPIVVMPLFGVVKIDAITSEYANDVIFLFVGSFTIAVVRSTHKFSAEIPQLTSLSSTIGDGAMEFT